MCFCKVPVLAIEAVPSVNERITTSFLVTLELEEFFPTVPLRQELKHGGGSLTPSLDVGESISVNLVLVVQVHVASSTTCAGANVQGRATGAALNVS